VSHAPHPDIHDHGLADDCPRCAEIAGNPVRDLDGRALCGLLERTLANRFGGGGSPFGEQVGARSEAEAVAMAMLMSALERAGHLAAEAPDLFVLYLLERWHVEFAPAP